MPTLNKAIDFLEKVDLESQSKIDNHDLIQALKKNSDFKNTVLGVSNKKQCKEEETYIALATATAKGLIAYEKHPDHTFNEKTRDKILPAITTLEEALKHSQAFECEFEQHMFMDMLERLKKTPTPARGYKTRGTTKTFQQRIMLKELTLSLMDHEISLSPANITRLAGIIDPDISDETVKSFVRKEKEKLLAWRKYSKAFLNTVYIPYCTIRNTILTEKRV